MAFFPSLYQQYQMPQRQAMNRMPARQNMNPQLAAMMARYRSQQRPQQMNRYDVAIRPGQQGNLGQMYPQQQQQQPNWRNFQFQNPTSGFQQNFNYLHSINPDLAFSYGLSPQAPGNEVKRAVDQFTGSNIGNSLINQFNEPVPTSQQFAGLGMGNNWQPPKPSVDWSIDSSGKNLSYGGQNYTLPSADKAYMPYQPPAQEPVNAGAGSEDWWRALQAFQR